MSLVPSVDIAARVLSWGLVACGPLGCGGDGARALEEGSSDDGDVMTTIPVTADATSPDTDDPTTPADTSGDPSDATTAGDASTGDPTGGAEVDVCPTEFTYADGAGISAVRIAGEWQGFDLPTAAALAQDGATWRATIDLPPGLHAYKVVVDDANGTQWLLDPAQGRRKYVDEVENSAILVPDCNLPRLVVDDHGVTRPGAGSGEFTATLRYVDGAPGDGADAPAFTAVLRHDDDERALGDDELVIDATTGDATLVIGDLDDGKYTVVVTPVDGGGRSGLPLRLPFWVEAEAFDWRDAVIYMVMTDRFRNGDSGNDPPPTPNADPRGDFLGGDLQGVRDAIEDGTLDALGVRAIWLSPLHENPGGAFLASDGVHQVTGYHGYWPVTARTVDARLGGEAALREMVAAAHAHGIRVLQDFVVNHVHEDHEYMAEHPEWFRTGCVCGTNGCDWTANALECTFTEYLPDIDHRVPEANAAVVDDAVWWLDTYDLDGLRVDAVKHVEEAAIRNLAAAVREGFEAAGTRYFLMGETAMGWNDCADPCNDENYGTIARYVGPHGLDGQFDFVLYHGVSYRVFAYGDNGMLHADYWFGHGQTKWPQGAVMTPYIGSHDTSRFATMADYRGQDGAHSRSIASNQWTDTAVAPGDGEPYRRARVAFAWLLGLPGAPLMYYGDEYGQWGGADPNNRLMWRDEDQLGSDEADTLAFVRALGQARREVPALRRGEYLSLGATEDTLAFARLVGPGDAAIVAFTRALGNQQIDVDVVQLGLAPGTMLTDVLGGAGATVDAGGDVTITIPASGAVILTP
jgi:glycosidase